MTDTTPDVREKILQASRSPHADLVAALGALTEVPKTGKVSAGQRQYTFMKLPDLLGAVRTVFAAHHLAVSQLVENHEHGITVSTLIRHSSGHVFESPALTLRCSQDPQSLGSAITYGRRYQLAALVGLAGGDDDDAQTLTHSTPPAPPERRPAPAGGVAPVSHRGGDVLPGTASEQSIKYLWTLLNKTTMDEASIRGWVAEILDIDPDWSTKTLSQAQVSAVIERLKAQGSDTTI